MIPRLLAISPPRTGPWLHGLGALADAGVGALLVRLVDDAGALEAVLAAADRTPLAIWIRPCHPRDHAIAAARGLGVHLPDAPGARAPDAPGLRSRSCHDPAGVRDAAAAGFDLCTLAPVYAPGSKPGDRRPTLGIAGLRAACAAAPGFPVLALGGVRPGRVRALRAAGAHGVAGITGFFDGLRVDRAGAAALARATATCDVPAPRQ